VVRAGIVEGADADAGAGMMQAVEREDLFQRPRVNLMQACAIAGVSRRTMYYWLQLGKIEYVRTAGGAVRIYADTLLRRIDTD
jgi:excisionase family DNA binding protein